MVFYKQNFAAIYSLHNNQQEWQCTVAINTGFNKSFDNNTTMFCTDEPNTFLTPISLKRFVAVNEASQINQDRQQKWQGLQIRLIIVCWRISALI